MSKLSKKNQAIYDSNILIAEKYKISDNGLNVINNFFVKYYKGSDIIKYDLSIDTKKKIKKFDLKSNKEYFLMIMPRNPSRLKEKYYFATEKKAKKVVIDHKYGYYEDYEDYDYKIDLEILRAKDLVFIDYRIELNAVFIERK